MVFRVKIENEDELIEAIAKVDLRIPYSPYNPDTLNDFLDFLDENMKLNHFINILEDELEAKARHKIEVWVKKEYAKWKKQKKGEKTHA